MFTFDWLRAVGRADASATLTDRAASAAILGEVLDGDAGDLAAGAFAATLAGRRAAADQLAGYLDALHERCAPLDAPHPVVVLPSYGRPTLLPNLTPLLALLLAQAGVRVIVHGHGCGGGDDAVATEAVFHDLGLPVAACSADLDAAWARHEPAYVPLDALCPPLARWIDRLGTVGLDVVGRRLAALIDPVQRRDSLRVLPLAAGVPSDEAIGLATGLAAPLVLLGGTDGEPVADPQRPAPIDVWLRGRHTPALSSPAREGVLAERPLLPHRPDAATTALYVQAVASGEKPAPASLARQVDLVLAVVAAVAPAAAAATRLAR
jgi:anthranilate phosphoribosyltransferase